MLRMEHSAKPRSLLAYTIAWLETGGTSASTPSHANGRLFLAGDAAHIVPPTGAKGLNLAAGDVKYLSIALTEHYQEKSDAGIDTYSQRALARIWRAERFSWWLTTLMHQFPESGAFGQRMQEAELDYLVHSQALSTSLAENYVGLPLDFG